MDGRVELEELEPLFDYSRVQPVDLLVYDDDSLEAYPIGLDRKKRKRNCNASPKKTVKNGKGSCDVVILDDENEKGSKKLEEEDWLPSPPRKMISSEAHTEVDETLKELRLRKQELASFAQSADKILKEVVESARQEIISSKSSAESGVEKNSKSQVVRQKIVISIQDKDQSKQFRVNKDEKLDRLFKTYAERIKINFEKLVFCFDGDKIYPGASPESLGMEDDDMIEVHIKSH